VHGSSVHPAFSAVFLVFLLTQVHELANPRVVQYAQLTVTGQHVDMPTYRLPTRELDISRTGQLMD